jgi:thiosulfate dehydrogenase [quinone] large subunit
MNSLFSRNKPIPVLIAFLRIILGWHFLYEGLIKLLNPDWSARPYLEGSRWIFGDLFRRMAESDIILQIVDSLNAWGLTLTGFALMVVFLPGLPPGQE